MAKKTTNKKRQTRKEQRSDLPIIIIIAFFAIVIVGLIVFSKLPKTTSNETVATVANSTDYVAVTSVTEFHIHSTASGLSMGNPDAKVKVEEFADFQCPYCQYYYTEIEPIIIAEYVDTGKIYYTISPMAFVGQESVDALEAAYCANDQGKFWEYRDYLFANLTGENVGSFVQTNLLAFADALGLDMTTFESCLTSGQHYADVQAANNHGSESGINSTPSFTVNGRIVNAGEVQQAIEDALAQ